MSKEVDERIDAVRKKLVETAGTQIGYGNYKQQLRAYQEMFLGVINVLDDLNTAIDAELEVEEEKENG